MDREEEKKDAEERRGEVELKKREAGGLDKEKAGD